MFTPIKVRYREVPSLFLSRAILVLTLFAIAPLSAAHAQDSLRGTTPSGLTPGAPAGSYSLSGFDSINLYNGNLNFSLPIVSVGGRGSAGANIGLLIERRWSVRREQDPDTGTVINYPDYLPPVNAPPYMGGIIEARTAGNVKVICTSQIFGDRYVWMKTLTRLTIRLGDGTQYELRDADTTTATGGEPKFVPRNYYGCPTSNPSRGKIFTTFDGSSATFISDNTIYDEPFVDDVTAPPDLGGILMLKDGSRWRFDNGLLSSIRDRNGNRLTFTYSLGGAWSITATDSLNRQVVVEIAVYDTSYGWGDKITYKGFGGTSRSVFIQKDYLANVLRSDQTLKTYVELFPSLNGSSSTSFNNPGIAKALYLPNGQSYQFKYNSYGELARVVLPTGGAIEYDWAAGDASTISDGGVVPTLIYMDYGVYRRVMERRVYADGSNLDHKMIYERATEISGGVESSVVSETRDASNNLLSKQKSTYFGSARRSFDMQPLDYSKWQEGKDKVSEAYAADGSTVLRSTTNTYAQRAAISWWTGAAADAPPNDPRLTQADNALLDTNVFARQTFAYDQYNNQTDSREFGYSSFSGGKSSFIRRTHTDYLATLSGSDYVGIHTNPLESIHIRNLPSQTWVSSDDAGNTKKSKTEFEYDQHSGGSNAALVDRSSISGHDSAFTTSYTTRGNATAIKRWLLPSTTFTSYQHYDIAGNVVKIKDARGYDTDADYSDRFGAPNGDARANSGATELGSQYSYAFATKVTNALGHETYSQFDFYTGRAVDGEDINGIISSGYSTSEPLDRPTRIIRAVGTAAESQTSFAYDDTNRIVTTTSDLSSNNDNSLKTESLYDGLGRTYETRNYETSWTYIRQTQTFDAVGRVKRSYNPFRTTSDPTYGYAENTYDALGRVTNVATSDGSQVTTAYSGNAVTVTDQAGKVRRSFTDAAGRMFRIDEPDASGNLGAITSPNQQTTYTYDVLNNLLSVAQGVQTRTFQYDSLNRLTSAANPESGTITYGYDNNGNLTSKIDARTITTSYTYDVLNRVTQRSYNDSPQTPTVTYTYDDTAVSYSKGKLTKVYNSNSTTEYTAFDVLGRVTAHKQTTGGTGYTTAYTYNLAGALLEETYPSGRMVKNTVATNGDLSQVETKPSGGSYANRASNFTYTAPGAVASMQLGNSKWESTVFNTRLQPTQIGLGTSSTDTSLLKLQYGYGINGINNGNVLSQTITVPGLTLTFQQTYTYDTLNRLASATETYNSSQTWTQSYGYDRYGNRNVTAGHGTTGLTFNSSNNRITTTGYTYDNAGNTTADPSGKTFVYDGENKQKTVSNTGGTLGTYFYDGDGKRVKKDALTGDDIIFIYDAAGKLIEERDLSGVLQTSYIWNT